MINGAEFMRRELMIRLVRAFDEGVLEKEINHIPIKIRSQNDPPSRCCIYHDRAIIKYRLMALLGFLCENELDESKTLSEYYQDVIENKISDSKDKPLSVCGPGCSACPDAKFVVTENCRGCFARPCLYVCPKKAISVDSVSHIDQSKCIKCGKCLSVCPFHAIIKTTVPCEEACPVNAIHKGENGRAEIDYSRCIYCGKCFVKCPFSAIMERSQMIKVLIALQQKEKLVAMIAPSAQAQFPGTIEQLFTAVSKMGFIDVMEVALGAELTTQNESNEFVERMGKNEKIMTTSCCPAYVEMVRKHLPESLHCVSTTPSPMRYASEIVKKQYPDAKTVFIGPCIAKRVEAERYGIDFVLSFEELGSMLGGRKIDIITCEPWTLPRPASTSARNYAKSCGVTKAVLEESCGAQCPLDAKFINGVDKKSVAMLKMYFSGKLPANFLEVMACDGGCIGGPGSLVK